MHRLQRLPGALLLASPACAAITVAAAPSPAAPHTRGLFGTKPQGDATLPQRPKEN